PLTCKMVFVDDAHECCINFWSHTRAWEYPIKLAGGPKLQVLGFAPLNRRQSRRESLGTLWGGDTCNTGLNRITRMHRGWSKSLHQLPLPATKLRASACASTPSCPPK